MSNKIWQTIHPRKFGYGVAYALPPTRTDPSCKPISNVTMLFSHVSHPYQYDYIDSCQNQTSADNYHMTVLRAQKKH